MMGNETINNEEKDEELKQKETDKGYVGIVREIAYWVITLAIAFIVAKAFTTYIVVNANIPSESMENTVMKDDRLIANRLAYLSDGPERGDIVVFKYPVHEETLYIKRVIGLPGETVEIIDGKIYIDGSEKPLEEDYLPEEWVIANTGYKYEIPEDSYFLMGDNRNISEDARFWENKALEAGMSAEEAKSCTFVKKDKIEGKAVFRYWPISDFKVF